MEGAGSGLPDAPAADAGPAAGRVGAAAELGTVAGPPARLKVRPDFLRAATGGRVHSRSLSLQVYRRPGDDPVAGCRVGLTVTKKVGNAVERNRIKRRLRDALRRPGLATLPDHDYVIVARRDALSVPFAGLADEVRRCLADAGKGRTRGAGPRRKPGPKRGADDARRAPRPQ